MRQIGRGKLIATIMAVMILGIGTYAFAGWGQGGQGCGRNNRMAVGSGECPYGYGAPAYSSDEQKQQAEAEILAFFNASNEIRRQMCEKELTLRAELVKKETDVKVATALQKEISDLQAQLDQKRLEHTIKMKTIVPDAIFGCGRDGGCMVGSGTGCMAGSGGGWAGSGAGCMAGKGKGGFGRRCAW